MISPFWAQLGTILFIERHPYDALISYWYKLKKHDQHPRFVKDINRFAVNEFPYVATMIRLGRSIATHRVRYEELRRDPTGEISGLIRAVFGAVNPAHLALAIENASVRSVRRLEGTGRTIDLPSMPQARSLSDRNTPRDGSSRQWVQSLNPKTIDELDSRLDQFELSDLKTEYMS